MKKISILFFLIISVIFSSKAQDTESYFPLPIVPDTISTFQDKTDYLISHYWDFCDMKKAFNNKQKMGEAFKQYLRYTPYGSARKVHKSIATLLKKVEKQPNDVLFLAQIAREYVHSDTSNIYSDELYLPFARAVAENKKIPEVERKPFEKDAKVLFLTQKNMVAPGFTYVDREGNRKTFTPDSTDVTIIFFASSDCSDCTLARSRLNSDIKSSNFVRDGVMKVFVINPDPNDSGWSDASKNYPQEWEVGYSTDVDNIYDIRMIPSFYVIDSDQLIQLKNVDINTIINLITLL